MHTYHTENKFFACIDSKVVFRNVTEEKKSKNAKCI